MGLNLKYSTGQTPIDANESDGLKIKTITTQSELNEFEQLNIERAMHWTLRKRFTANQILSEEFILSLHKKMYGDVWKWAGKFRTSEKNLGIPFPIIGIENAADWSYDFKDGKGPVLGAYGPNFIRLKVDDVNIFQNVDLDTNFAIDNKFQGIGIHGTHLNGLIGKRASHGCIRMKNEDLKDLRQYIQAGTLVVIVPGKLDIQENTNPKTIIKDKNN